MGKQEKEKMLLIIELYEALQKAEQHLSYCGYGDTWERECAREDKLEERISTALIKTEKLFKDITCPSK